MKLRHSLRWSQHSYSYIGCLYVAGRSNVYFCVRSIADPASSPISAELKTASVCKSVAINRVFLHPASNTSFARRVSIDYNPVNLLCNETDTLLSSAFNQNRIRSCDSCPQRALLQPTLCSLLEKIESAPSRTS
jgi:hypothetical protein